MDNIEATNNQSQLMKEVLATLQCLQKQQIELQQDIAKEKKARAEVETKLAKMKNSGNVQVPAGTQIDNGAKRSTRRPNLEVNNISPPVPVPNLPATKLDALENKSSCILNKLESLAKIVEQIKESATKNEIAIDNLEQYGRRNCILLHGCKRIPKAGHYGQFETYVANTLNSALKLEWPIQYGDIDVTHILPADGKGNVPIIVKFVRRSTKNMIYSMKRRLKKTGLSITESLTKRRVELLTEARRVLGLKNVWTMNGDIYGFHNGQFNTERESC
ncbi:uncharacterized protein LOC144422705 isoform X2 [Styela clava]